MRTSTAEGWSVRETRGAMQLQVRRPGEPMQTVAPPPSGKLSPVFLTTRGLAEMTSAALQRGSQS